MVEVKKEQEPEKTKKATEQAQKRNLRRKMDQVEHKIKQIKLKNFLAFTE